MAIWPSTMAVWSMCSIQNVAVCTFSILTIVLTIFLLHCHIQHLTINCLSVCLFLLKIAYSRLSSLTSVRIANDCTIVQWCRSACTRSHFAVTRDAIWEIVATDLAIIEFLLAGLGHDLQMCAQHFQIVIFDCQNNRKIPFAIARKRAHVRVVSILVESALHSSFPVGNSGRILRTFCYLRFPSQVCLITQKMKRWLCLVVVLLTAWMLGQIPRNHLNETIWWDKIWLLSLTDSPC